MPRTSAPAPISLIVCAPIASERSHFHASAQQCGKRKGAKTGKLQQEIGNVGARLPDEIQGLGAPPTVFQDRSAG